MDRRRTTGGIRAYKAPFALQSDGHSKESGRLQGVPATVVVGAQWGDEGKGKIVDLLAQRSDLVCRYQGGPNAGHTIVVGDETYKIRATPSGVISGKLSIIGAGCVVDPEVLIAELDDLEQRGIDTSVVVVSGNAHLIMPWHISIDQASERRLGKLQIGTTRRGIGPCYADKASRIGIRVQDILDPKILRQKIEVALAEKNVWLERVYEVDGFELDEVATRYEEYAKRLRPFVGDASLIVDQALRDGKEVLFEGAQATLLDLDHGTYPFVTSSNPIASGAATGMGIGPTRIDRVLGVTKAYVTRVGEGPFPSEIQGPDQVRLRELGGEFGTVTGRERRCGWLDLVALRYAVRVNGMTSLALTKLDVLSDFAELPVCVAYRLPDGSETRHFPSHQSDFHHAQPIWRVLPGWQRSLEATATRAELPEEARAYLDFTEGELEVPVELVGIGAGRERVLV
jgi:adenylosuccinate synthase